MEILITGGAFLGAVLGRFFKVLILVPASALLIALLVIKTGIAGPALVSSFVKIALLIASLELGYVTGLISTDVSSLMQGFRDRLSTAPPHGVITSGSLKVIGGLENIERRDCQEKRLGGKSGSADHLSDFGAPLTCIDCERLGVYAHRPGRGRIFW